MKISTNFILVSVFILSSCSTSKSVISSSTDIAKYSYVVFGKTSTGDRELDDVILAVQNEIIATRLQPISDQDAFKKLISGNFILSPNINVKTEKWNGGHTYITITFHDYATDQVIIILKSSGIGSSILQDQKKAIKAISRELKKVFKY